MLCRPLLDRLLFKRVGLEAGVIVYALSAGPVTLSLRAHPPAASRPDFLYELEVIATRADNLSARLSVFAQDERFLPEPLLKDNLEHLQGQLIDLGQRWRSAA